MVNIIKNFNQSISVEAVNSYKEMGKVIVFLINYASYHFESEESFMLSIAYPDLSEHKEEHRALVKKLKDILIKFKKKQSYTPIEFYYFLMSWLSTHIIEEDLKIGKYFKDNKNKIVFKKINLDNYESIIKVIQPNIDRIDLLIEKKVVEKAERENILRNFLQSFYSQYNIEDLTTIIQILKSLIYLLKNKSIEKKEVDKISFIHELYGILKDFSFETNQDKFEVKSLQDQLGKI